MLRSELEPKPFSAMDAFAVLGVATLILIATLSVVWLVAAHTWQDDSRAKKLHELEKAHAVAPALESRLAVYGSRVEELAASYPLWTYPNDVVRPHVNTLTKVDIEVTLDGAKAFSAEVAKDLTLCSKAWCEGANECYSAVIYDTYNHVEFALPCVDGHVGTWVMTKLP